MREIYIVGSYRTPIGSFGGTLKNCKAARLGALVIAEAVKRTGISAGDIDQVIMGNVLQAGQGQNPARQAAIYAGLPVEIPAATLNKVCGSGLYAVNIAAALVCAGQAECIIAGGMENMSQAPHTAQIRWGQKMGDIKFRDSMVCEGLWDVFHDYHMGVTAENVAAQYGISRKSQDEFAQESQEKALRATNQRRFQQEIVKVPVLQEKDKQKFFEKDEHIRPDSTVEKLGRLKPAFQTNGTVTAGNASGINDGAAVLIVASREFVLKNKLHPQSRWISGAAVGVKPEVMGIGPIGAVNKALATAGLSIESIDLIEVNEAFASQALAVIKGIGANPEIVNVNGGAIALGHPIGASGARIAVTLLHEMQKRDTEYGLATLCIGGGMGEAVVFERDRLCR